MCNQSNTFDDVPINYDKPIRIKWNPQPDITIYELACCIPLLLLVSNNYRVMPQDISTEPYMRHFEIK